MAENITQVTDNVDDNERRRILQAIHAYKTHPSFANLGRLKRYVKAANDDVYVTNVVADLSSSISNSTRYSNFNQLFEALIEE